MAGNFVKKGRAFLGELSKIIHREPKPEPLSPMRKKMMQRERIIRAKKAGAFKKK